jgi:hypothetical protein
MDREVGGEDFRNHQTKNYTLYILGYLDICWFVCMLKIQLFLIILSKKRDKKVPIMISYKVLDLPYYMYIPLKISYIIYKTYHTCIKHFWGDSIVKHIWDIAEITRDIIKAFIAENSALSHNFVKKEGQKSPHPPPTHTLINTGRTIPRLLRPCYECFNDISCYFCDISYMFYNRVASKMFYKDI